MKPFVRPCWILIVLGVAPLVQAQSLHSPIRPLVHGGGHGGHFGGMMGGDPGGFLASGLGNQHGGMLGGVPGGFLASGFGNSPYGFGGGIASNGLGYGCGTYAIGNYGYGGFGIGGLGFGVNYPIAFNNGGGLPLIWPVMGNPGGMGGGGLMLPMPPGGMMNPNAGAPAPRPRNTNRAKELVQIGDRSFRGGNIKRADEKYHLASKTDPASPVPHVHMAQVSLARGDYLAAADHLRDAITVSTEGNWLLTTPDIQAIYAEPADFAKHLARLESHLQANPNDRDAWFVLGAESYLSGRTKQAADVFQRLTDRKPDEALAAFMDASKTKLPPPAN